MVRARESAGLAWLETYGITVPQWVVVTRETNRDALHIPFDAPYIVKPDVAIGGKGQRGLVHRCDDAVARDDAITELFTHTFNGEPLQQVIVEPMIVGDEFFLAIAIDEQHRKPVLRMAATGGVGFDATNTPVCEASLIDGLDDTALTHAIINAGFPADAIDTIGRILRQMWAAFVASEAVLVEINPLKWDGKTATAVGLACAFDAHSHTRIDAHRPRLETSLAATLGRAPTVREQAVKAADAREPDRPGMTFFELDGDIAFVVAGGGAALFTFDVLHDHGLTPACYTDYSPGGGLDKLTALFTAALEIPKIRGVFVGVAVLNVMDTQYFADALIAALQTTGVDPTIIPIVARIAGPSETVTLERLRAIQGLHVFGREKTLEHAGSVLVAELASVGL